ncbi:TolC family protein, partial [candidate division KSB1 bacterium]
MHRPITFDESLIIATQSSFQFNQQELEFKRDYYNLKSSQARLKSNAQLSFLLPSYEKAIEQKYISSDDSYQFVPSSRLRFYGSLRVAQPVPTGGDISFNTQLSHLKQKDTSENVFKNYFGRVFLELTQPILQPNQLKNEIEQRENQLQRTLLNYKSRKAGSLSWLTSTFYDLFRVQEQIKYNEEMIAQFQEAYRLAEERNNRGELSGTELLVLEVDLENIQSELMKYRSDLENSEERFKQQVGIPNEEHISAGADIESDPVNITLEEA